LSIRKETRDGIRGVWMGRNQELAAGRFMQASAVLVALSSLLIPLPAVGQVPRAEAARPLGSVEKYTFANPQTPLEEIQEHCKLSGEQAAKFAQQVRDLEKPITDAWEKARFDMLAVLTRDQVQEWRKGCVIKSIKFTYAKITLTPQQLTKIGALYDDCAGQADATFEAINAQVQKRVPSILTAEQKQQMGVK